MSLNAAALDLSAASFDPKQILEKPLITGASVSADFGTESPGKRLALRFTSPDKIKTIAHGGTPGVQTVAKLMETDFADRTSVIAIDLFFWDSVIGEQHEVVSALHRIVALSKRHDLPVVLGEIPELLPERQPNRIALNSAIDKACKEYSNCFVMPFNQLHKKLKSQGYIDVNGKKLTVRDIVPDGLHLSAPASDFLADTMLNLFTAR